MDNRREFSRFTGVNGKLLLGCSLLRKGFLE